MKYLDPKITLFGIKQLLFCSVFFCICACSEEITPPYQLEFLDQDASGSVLGAGVALDNGLARVRLLDEENIDVFLTDGQDCTTFGTRRVRLLTKNEIGLHPFDGSLYKAIMEHGSFRSGEVFDSRVVKSGFVEILDTAGTHITGRIDIFLDSENFLNGNFSLPKCDRE